MELMPLIITGIVFMLVGIAIGSLITSMSKENKDKSTRPVVDEDEWVEWVSLVSDNEGIIIYPRLHGQVYQKESDLPAKQRQDLNKALEAMQVWLGKPVVITPSVDSQIPPSAEPLPPVPIPPVINPELLVQPVVPPVTKSKMGPIDFFAKAIQSDVKTIKPETKSIAVQIDEILQERLLNSPMEKRGIRLLEFPGKGMVVMVGLDQYEGVEDVPDDEIRQLIREAVKEWETRYESGI